MKSNRNHHTTPCDVAKITTEEFAVAAIAHTFKSAPERLIYTVPEDKKTTAQTIASTCLDEVINLSARGMVNNLVSIPVGTITCTTAAISKAIALKDKNVSDPKKPEHFNIHDAEAIGKAMAQGCINRAIQYQVISLSNALAQESTSSIINIIVPVTSALFVTPLIQQIRLPDVPQVPDDEQSTAQQIGHMLANAAIAVSVGLLPISLPIGFIGCIIPIIGKTIIGKKRDQTEDMELQPKKLSM
jgi:hypothetical protein